MSALREKVQAQIVDLITKGLASGALSEGRAREIAQLVLEKMPPELSDEQLMQVIPKLDDEFQELSDVVLPIMLEYEEKIRSSVEQKLSILMKEQKFSDALDLAKKAIDLSSQLT